MPTLAELQEQRGRLVTQAREAMDEIRGNTDDSRAAELEQRHDTIMGEFDQIEASIEREQRQQDLEQRFEERQRTRRPQTEGETRASDPGLVLEYRQVFAKHICGDGTDLTPEERAVLKAGHAEYRAQSAGTSTAGGFTVPTELANQLIIAMKAHGPMYDGDIVTEIVTAGGGEIGLPTIDDTAQSGGAHAENAALTDDGGADAVFGRKTLSSHSYDTEFIRWSFELDADSIFNMETLLGSLLGMRMGRLANTKLTTGTGTNEPNGMVTASSLGVTTALGTAVTADELIDLVHSVDPAYRSSPKAGFMMNDSTVKAVRKLKDGHGNYLWQMGNVQQGTPQSLLGYNLHVNQAMASIPTAAAAAKVALFGDFGSYFVRKVGQPVIGVLRERFWPDNGIAGIIRIDGELGDTAAVKHLITKAS